MLISVVSIANVSRKRFFFSFFIFFASKLTFNSCEPVKLVDERTSKQQREERKEVRSPAVRPVCGGGAASFCGRTSSSSRPHPHVFILASSSSRPHPRVLILTSSSSHPSSPSWRTDLIAGASGRPFIGPLLKGSVCIMLALPSIRVYNLFSSRVIVARGHPHPPPPLSPAQREDESGVELTVWTLGPAQQRCGPARHKDK